MQKAKHQGNRQHTSNDTTQQHHKGKLQARYNRKHSQCNIHHRATTPATESATTNLQLKPYIKHHQNDHHRPSPTPSITPKPSTHPTRAASNTNAREPRPATATRTPEAQTRPGQQTQFQPSANPQPPASTGSKPIEEHLHHSEIRASTPNCDTTDKPAANYTAPSETVATSGQRPQEDNSQQPATNH
jgi:hypothetical protein